MESHADREANRLFTILTERFGLISAIAQGVRRRESKLSPHLREFASVHVTLVRGKGTWRITHASLEDDMFASLRFRPEALRAAARITVLLKRLVRGEAEHAELFTLFREGMILLGDTKLYADDILHAEALIVLRLLSLLGYVGERKEFESLVASPFLSLELVSRIKPLRKVAIEEINRSLRASDL